jgi:tetratricopeptide (TPR) repeat protein
MPSNHVAKLFKFKFNEYDSLLTVAKEFAAQKDYVAALGILDELIQDSRYAFIPDTYLERATIYFEQKNYTAAKTDCFKIANQLSKRLLGAHILLAKIFTNEKDNVGFLKVMSKIKDLRASIAKTRTWFNRTILFNLSAHPKQTQAHELHLATIKDSKQSPANIENLHCAIMAFAESKFDTACYYFEKSIKATPHDFIAMFHLTNMTLRRVMDIQDLPERIKEMETCLQQLDYVIDEYGYARAYALRATINYSQENYTQAMQDFGVSIRRYEPEDFQLFNEKHLQLLSTLSKHGKKLCQTEDVVKAMMKTGLPPKHNLQATLGYASNAVVSMLNSNYEDALLYISMALWTNDKGTTFINLRTCQYFNMRAHIYMILGNMPEANHNLTLAQRYTKDINEFINGCAGDELDRLGLHALKAQGRTPHPKDPYLKYLLQNTAADLYLKTDFPQIGLEILKNTIKEFPHLPDAYHQRINYYLEIGMNVEALPDIQTGLDLNPCNLALLRYLKNLNTDKQNSIILSNRILAAVHKLETFRSWYEKILSTVAMMPVSSYQTSLAFLGEEALQNNNPRLAAYYFTLVVNANKYNFIARAGRGLALLKLSDLPGATRDFKHHLNKHDYSRAHLGLGLAEYEKGYHQLAGVHFRKALSRCFEADYPLVLASEPFIVDAVKPVTESVLQAELYYMDAMVHYDIRDYNKAHQYFSLAIYLNDALSYKYYFYRSYTQLFLDNYKAAHTDVTRAIDSAKRNNASNEDLLILKSLFSTYCLKPLAMVKENLTKALSFIDAGLSVHPTRELYYERAKNRFQAGHFSEAKKALEAMKTMPSPEPDILKESVEYLAEAIAKKVGNEVVETKKPEQLPAPAKSAVVIAETPAITADAAPEPVKKAKKKKKNSASLKSKPKKNSARRPASSQTESETLLDAATPASDEPGMEDLAATTMSETIIEAVTPATASETIAEEATPKIVTHIPSTRNVKTQRNKQRRRAGRRKQAEEPNSPLETSATETLEVVTPEPIVEIITPQPAVTPPPPAATPEISAPIELILPRGKSLKELLTWANKKPLALSPAIVTPTPDAIRVETLPITPDTTASDVASVTEKLIAGVIAADSARLDVVNVLNDLTTQAEVNDVLNDLITQIEIDTVINDLITQSENAHIAEVVQDILGKITASIEFAQKFAPSERTLEPFVDTQSDRLKVNQLKISVSSLSLNDGLASNQSSPIFANLRDSISQPRLSRLATDLSESEIELESNLSPLSRNSFSRGSELTEEKSRRDSQNSALSPYASAVNPACLFSFPKSTRQFSANAATFVPSATPTNEEFLRFLLRRLPQQYALYELEQQFIEEIEELEANLNLFPNNNQHIYFFTYIVGGSLTDRVLKGLQANLLAYHTPSVHIFNYLNKPWFQRKIIVDDIDIVTQLPVALISQIAAKLGWEPLIVIREPAVEQLGFAPDFEYRSYLKNGVKIDIVHKPVIDFAHEAKVRDSGLFMDRHGVLIDISNKGRIDLLNGEVRVTTKQTHKYVIEPLKLLHAIHTSTKRKFSIHDRETLKQCDVNTSPIQASYINSALRKLFFPGRIVENYKQIIDFQFFQYIYWPQFSDSILRDDEWILIQLNNSDKQARPSLKHIHAIFITNFVMHNVMDVLITCQNNYSFAFSPVERMLQNGTLLNECNNVINMLPVFQDVYSKTSAVERNSIFEIYINSWKVFRHDYVMSLVHPLLAPPAYSSQDARAQTQPVAYQNDSDVELAPRYGASR